MGIVIFLVVIGTSIGVAVDASNLGVRRGLLGSSIADMGPAGWFFCCLLLWIVAFPAYLITRPKYVAAAAAKTQAWPGTGGPVAPARLPPPPYGGCSPAHPVGQYSGFTAAPQLATSEPWAVPPANQAAPAAVTAAVPAGGSVVDQLTRLSELRQSGALTEAEFELLKGQLLGGAAG